MKTKKQKIANGILVAVMLVLSLFFLFPVIWMIANSFKPDAAITADMNSVSAFIPPAPGKGFFDNYKEILFNTRFLRFMANTLFYAAIMIVAGVIVNGLAAGSLQSCEVFLYNGAADVQNSRCNCQCFHIPECME